MKKMTYLLSLTLLVVSVQFAFADAENSNGKQPYIGFEDVQAALPDKEFYKPQEPVFTRSAPDWQDDPGAYQFVATLSVGIVYSDGVNMADEGDMFAAFDDAGNVRGVAAQLTTGFGPYAGQTYYEMTMRSNADGDLLSFQYYDASEDAVLDITETYEFGTNDILGHLVEGAAEFNIGFEDLSCPECVDNDAGVAPFTCASAVASFGCDMVWGTAPISESCPASCGACPEEDGCGVCEGDGSSCSDCAGVPNGDAEADCFGTCNGDGFTDCSGSFVIQD